MGTIGAEVSLLRQVVPFDLMTCVLLNTRFVCNTPVTVKEHMIDQKADLRFLTET